MSNPLKNSSWPKYESEEINAITSIMESNKVNYWTGDEGRKFEVDFAQWCGPNML